MQGHLSIEELILDDSFANYCFQSNEEDVLFWEAYLEVNPSQKEKIKEARQMVIGLCTVLQEMYDQEDNPELQAENATQAEEKVIVPKRPLRKILRYSIAAAAVLIVAVSVNHFDSIGNRLGIGEGRMAKVKMTNQQVFRTANGERRSFVLPDSTTISLNAGSILRLEEGFGITNRTVHLSGEALFDVTHNTALPFIVRINNYDVKVLGTLFNVRAYPNDAVSETSLVKGKVQILKNDGGDLTLVPNQKVVFNSMEDQLPSASLDTANFKTITTQRIVPVSISPIDGAVLETAWAHDRLEIVNESFDAIRHKLERWYNVQIVFADKEVSQYTFTATFEKENIRQVLEALRFTYPFDFKIDKGIVTISK